MFTASLSTKKSGNGVNKDSLGIVNEESPSRSSVEGETNDTKNSTSGAEKISPNLLQHSMPSLDSLDPLNAQGSPRKNSQMKSMAAAAQPSPPGSKTTEASSREGGPESSSPNRRARNQQDSLCNICMDNLADCILLECGHMVTCTQCGKRLANCPICRQYISRVVRVFRT
ncbi:E3 ubiquitin-protein ligase RNF34 [Elysia marginata]|uniref:E3 ubiquitin-protein ligase RNF34 n=1 Tax=Elysia marginata TaxID=1093978 RepID=A0AAV4F1V8_9GAST|nr:E3 ubiquitin-protein ligase RNF34 [Elysia marginata]